MVFASLLLLVIVGFTFLTTTSIRAGKTPKGLKRVPGPSGLPILGNAHQLGQYPQRALRKWGHQYGDIFQIRLGWENWIYLSSPNAVKEILDKQSAVTSGRMPMPVLSDLISGDMRFLFMSYSPRWRKLRTIVHKLLTPKASESFRPSQEFEAKQLVHDILTDNRDVGGRGGEGFYTHVRRYTTSVVMTSTYGKRVPVWDCEDTREVYGLMKEFSEAAIPGAFIADMFPPLAKLPTWMQWWRKRALAYQERQSRIWMKYWSNLRVQMATKQAPECFVKQFIETDFEKQGISELQAAFVAGTMIEAGSETTSSSLNSAILYMAANPTIQARAAEELCRAIGDYRSPTFADEPQLPYIRSAVKEVLRIRPVTNIGTPHYTTLDLTYKDFFIPKDTVVSINQYAIHYDPNLWPAEFPPDKFIPDRYLKHDLKAGAYAAHPDPYQRDHFGFGAGRRICPGMHLAEASLFITLAKILWAFEIRPRLDGNGREEVLSTGDEAYEDGVNTLPKPFKVRFIPRNAEKERVIRQEWKRAKEGGFILGNVRVGEHGVVI